MKQHALNWFEIFVKDFGRATTFYEAILEIAMEPAKVEGGEMAMFPFSEDGGVGGAVTNMECGQPGPGGTVVYLNVNGKLDEVISRIPGAGGKVVKERTPIPPHGFIAIMEDPDGNIVGLHSMS